MDGRLAVIVLHPLTCISVCGSVCGGVVVELVRASEDLRVKYSSSMAPSQIDMASDSEAERVEVGGGSWEGGCCW